MPDYLEIVIRTFVAFVIFVLLNKIIGKQLIGQTTYYHFIAAITLGSIAGNMTFNLQIKLIHFIISMLLFSGIVIVTTLISIKSDRIRKLLTGEPVFVIKNGQILEQTLNQLKYSLDSLKQGLRKKDIFNFEEVEEAILEINGTLSVLKKPSYQNVTRQDLSGIVQTKMQSPVELIMEGKILDHNLKKNQLTQEWLAKELSSRGLEVSDVFYAIIGTNGHLFIDLYADSISSPDAKAEK